MHIVILGIFDWVLVSNLGSHAYKASIIPSPSTDQLLVFSPVK